ncbi:MAG: transposase zinc-binding domain-containing protein, partial [Chloroflexi bacterium]|nr:transposase zinc-binding domain-containing protein [Chloroflexota bacterium]
MQADAPGVEVRPEGREHRTGEERRSVNEIFRVYGEAYAASHRLTVEQRRVMRNLVDCRSGALGGHIDQCDRCGAVHYFPHS